MHNETLSVAAMRVGNSDCPHSESTAKNQPKSQPPFIEITGN